MTPDALNNAFPDIMRAMVDPSAPLPSIWPGGIWGVFLVFCTQIGAGIPLGVIMARDAGIPPLVTGVLYLLSDIVLAFMTEPMLAALRWLARRVNFVARIGNRLARLSGSAGLQTGGVRGPLGLILFSFAVAPAPARAASEAAGHGFVSGWTLAIIGDMFYFALIMASTLWISTFVSDDRLTIGVVIVGTWLLSTLLMRRMNRAQPQAKAARARPAPLRVVAAAATPVLPVAEVAQLPRKPAQRTERRRRPTRGLHG